jgi:hypothetical protein
MYPETYNRLNTTRHKQWGRQLSEQEFICRHCHAWVYTHPLISGVQNRNHCPYCLWSRHIDQSLAGDRMSACKAIMQPIGLTMKRSYNKYGQAVEGELMLIHRCHECGKLSINRIAADDLTERLMDIFYASPGLEGRILEQLMASGIRLLREDESLLVISRLQGISQY